MEDHEIVNLYWERSEEAVSATAEKYGGNCHFDSGGNYSEEQDGLLKCFCAFRFSQMLPLDEIESITIEGVEIPLS